MVMWVTLFDDPQTWRTASETVEGRQVRVYLRAEPLNSKSMKAFEFKTQPNPDGTLTIPSELATQMEMSQVVRVILLIGEPDEEGDWASLTTNQFLQGYDTNDALYDNVSGR